MSHHSDSRCLQLEVLSAPWWQSLDGASEQSAAMQRCKDTITAVGAGSLALAALAGGQEQGTDASGRVTHAAAMLHHLYIKPTVCTLFFSSGLTTCTSVLM